MGRATVEDTESAVGRAKRRRGGICCPHNATYPGLRLESGLTEQAAGEGYHQEAPANAKGLADGDALGVGANFETAAGAGVGCETRDG